jgi:hypothetical protein
MKSFIKYRADRDSKECFAQRDFFSGDSDGNL